MPTLTDRNPSMHTPGPWEIAKEHHPDEPLQYKIGTGKDGWLGLALVFGDTEDEAKANACLISAVPDLLEVAEGLHKALARMIDKHDPDSIEAEWLSHSHEAITKARGGKP